MDAKPALLAREARHGSSERRGVQLNRIIAGELRRFDRRGVWKGDIDMIRAGVDELAGDPVATVAAGVDDSTTFSIDKGTRRGALALQRVALAKACLDLAPREAVLAGSGFPVALLVAFAAGGLARMPSDDSYEAENRSRFDGIDNGEIETACCEISRSERLRPGRDEWRLVLNGEAVTVIMVRGRFPLDMRLEEPGGRTYDYGGFLIAALPGDGLCNYEDGEIDYFRGRADHLDLTGQMRQGPSA